LASSPSQPEDWPEGAIYHSRLGLFAFQNEGVAQAYLRRQAMVIFDQGLGKTHIAMRLAALLREDDELSTCMVVCERNTLRQWRDFFGQFTRLDPLIIHGPKRQERLARYVASQGRLPDVLISTYETLRLDTTVATVGKSKRTSRTDGWLLERLLPAAGKMLLVYDEVSKLKNRNSATYKAHERTLVRLRRANKDLRVLGLTATPISKDRDDAFNEYRLVCPGSMPPIGHYQTYFHKGYDRYGRPRWHSFRLDEFDALCTPWTIRKRKSDDDVRDQFPELVEQSWQIEMKDDQKRLYELVEDLGLKPDSWPADRPWEPPGGLWTVLRQVVAHPASLTLSDGIISRLIVEELGADYLRSISSTKTEALVEYLRPIVLGQGAKAVVFSFFGQSVLPLLAEALRTARMLVFTYHGGMTDTERNQAIAAFRSSAEPCVFLSSDAGARGINLPEGEYVIEYESAGTHEIREQRINRCSRIDGTKKLLTAMTFVVDGTVEVPIIKKMIERNQAHDSVRGDQDAEGTFMSAEERAEVLRLSLMSRRKR
jgi:SNF2 family DNA or RNA helicase